MVYLTNSEQAGLFSAVLTAFIIASLVLLQPDNSQTTVQLLSLLVLRDGGAPSRMQSFLNETADSLPESTDFQIPRTVSTIDRKSTRLNSSHSGESRMPSSA